jgi:hypothetical protein
MSDISRPMSAEVRFLRCVERKPEEGKQDMEKVERI